MSTPDKRSTDPVTPRERELIEELKNARDPAVSWMTAPPSTETPRHTAGGSSEVSREEYVRLIDAIDYTLTAHGKIDADTPLHDRIRKVYRAPIPENFRSSHAALTAKVAELEAALQEISSWKDDTLGARPKKTSPVQLRA